MGVATDPPAGGEGPLSEESRIFSSDDILNKTTKEKKNEASCCVHADIAYNIYNILYNFVTFISATEGGGSC